MKQIYKFRWDIRYIVYLTLLIPPTLFCIGYFLFIFFAFLSASEITGPIIISILYITAIGFPGLMLLSWVANILSSIIHHIEIEPGKITIVRLFGSKLEYKKVKRIDPINKDSFKEHTTWEYGRNGAHTAHGLTLLGADFHSTVYGRFNIISNNLDEIALITLANDKKVLINYPRELTTKDKINYVRGKGLKTLQPQNKAESKE